MNVNTFQVKSQYPSAPVALVGMSAGTGQVANYLGVMGEASEAVAGVMISPGYDISKCFGRWVGAWGRG
jgi:predicted alpha/beta-fold hydrolase